MDDAGDWALLLLAAVVAGLIGVACYMEGDAQGWQSGHDDAVRTIVCPMTLAQQATLADSLATVKAEPLCQWWPDNG